MTKEDIIKKAQEYATNYHNGQKRKCGKRSYISHPEIVFKKLVSIGIKDEEILAASWLHDVLEDTNATIEHISQEFNDKIAFYVSSLTRIKDGLDKDSRQDYLDKIKKGGYEVQIIKLADVWHNSQTLDILSYEKRKLVIDEIINFYLPLANKICPEMGNEIKSNIENALKSRNAMNDS